MYTLLYQKQGKKNVSSRIKLLFIWLKTSAFLPVLLLLVIIIGKSQVWLWGSGSPWLLCRTDLVHAILTILFLPSVLFCQLSQEPNPLAIPSPTTWEAGHIESYLWLGGGQSEPYSWTCMPKKHKSTPSISSKANRAFVRYGKDSAISPLSTNLQMKRKSQIIQVEINNNWVCTIVDL